MAPIIEPRRFLLLTSPRTASNLLVKMLNFEDRSDEVVKNGTGQGYFFLKYMSLLAKLKRRGMAIDEFTEEDKAELRTCQKECIEALEEYAKTAEDEDKIGYWKEHTEFLIDPVAMSLFRYGKPKKEANALPFRLEMASMTGKTQTWSEMNKTMLPDEYLATWRPTFLTRHPALVYPSQFRASRDVSRILELDFESGATRDLYWNRSLYTLYADKLLKHQQGVNGHGGVQWPVILDADDIISNPAVVIRYCKILGMDSSKLRFTWPAATVEDLEKIESETAKRMKDTLLASSGAIMSKSSAGIDIAEEAKKWKVEFGEEDGARIEKWVRDAMPYYEFFKARKLTAE